MKIAYFGYDTMITALEHLLNNGCELLAAFTFDADNVFNFNTQTIELARQKGAYVYTDPPTPQQIETLITQGCDLFIAMGYPFKIPPIDEKQAYGVNIHPSLLPKGRGLMPIPYILTQHPEIAGITAHKLAPNFDTGDILKQMPLKVHERETVETLSARISMAMPDFALDLVSNLKSYSLSAKPQDKTEATHFPPPSDDMRTLHWDKGIAQIDKTARAFGRFGSLAFINEQCWIVYALDCWPEDHNIATGTITLAQPRELIIAASDGFVCLKEAQQASPQ